MNNIAFLILLVGIGATFWGIKTNNIGRRLLGLKLAAVGLGLIVLSRLFNIEIFPPS